MVDYLDEVVNIVSGEVGTVDATYTIEGIRYVDVVSGNEMHYASPASNWEVTLKYEE